MRAKYLSAALTLLLVGSLTACGMGDTAGYRTGDSTASERSSLEENGVHDGMAPTKPVPYDQLPGESSIQSTPNNGNHTDGKNTLGDDLRNAGEDAKQGLEKAGRDAANAMRDSGNALDNTTTGRIK